MEATTGEGAVHAVVEVQAAAEVEDVAVAAGETKDSFPAIPVF